MPKKARRTCRRSGCLSPAQPGEDYCARCVSQAKQRSSSDRKRLNSNQRGYTYAWRKAAKAYRAKNPYCRLCSLRGIVTPSEVVDHVIPHRGNYELFWNQKNWQAICKRCHDAKTRAGE